MHAKLIIIHPVTSRGADPVTVGRYNQPTEAPGLSTVLTMLLL